MNDTNELVTLIKQVQAAMAAKAEETGIELGGLKQKMMDLQQHIAAGDHMGGGARLDPLYELNEVLEKSEPLKMLRAGNTKGVRLELPPAFMQKALTSADGIVAPQNVPGIFGMARRRLTIRDLMRTIPVESGSITYVRQNARTVNAAPVSEGNLKPESAVDLDFVTAPVITLAHFQHLSNQVLDDLPMLAQFIQDELRWGLTNIEEAQILKGSGVGLNLNGLYTQATAASNVTGTMADDLRRAIAQLAAANYQASGIVISPNDWASIELLKDADGNYIVGQPRGANPATLWNLPVIATTQMSDGTFLVGDFQAAGFIADRQSPTLDIATTDQDDFVRNMTKMRMEERLALAVTMPAALVKGVLA